uniref:Uncharacterized protein n=1 Tax=Arundo donax TaxID=35708 RepID=A0A0A8Z084_ARUDO
MGDRARCGGTCGRRRRSLWNTEGRGDFGGSGG